MPRSGGTLVDGFVQHRAVAKEKEANGHISGLARHNRLGHRRLSAILSGGSFCATSTRLQTERDPRVVVSAIAGAPSGGERRNLPSHLPSRISESFFPCLPAAMLSRKELTRVFGKTVPVAFAVRCHELSCLHRWQTRAVGSPRRAGCINKTVGLVAAAAGRKSTVVKG